MERAGFFIFFGECSLRYRADCSVFAACGGRGATYVCATNTATVALDIVAVYAKISEEVGRIS